MATAIATSALCCLNTQIALDNLAATPAGRFEQSGVIQALKSPENSRGYEQITNAVTESRRRPVAGTTPPTVEIKVRKPSCETVLTSAADLCDSGSPTSDPYDYLDVGVTRLVRLSGSITKAEFDDLCDNPDQRRVMKLRDFAEDLEKQIGIILTQDIYAQLGQYADATASTGVTTKAIPIISTDGTLNSAAFSRISSEFRQQGFRGRPIMVGGEKLAVGQDVRILGGTGTSLNLDPNAALNTTSSWYDYDFDATVNALQTTTNDSYAMTWTPGAVQMLEWYRNTGIFEEFKEDYVETKLTINGITYDYFMNYDKCTHEWTFHLQKRFDIFAIPDALYACNVGNGRVLWELSCGDMDCSIF
jgi:hypothetical protein